jgi:diaminopimelate decarboxylase
MRTTTLEERTWWTRPGLEVLDGRLRVAGRDAESLAREHGTPLYVHDLERIREQAWSLQTAMAEAGLRPILRLALKAQRDPDVLAFIRRLGGPGEPTAVQMDVCSPGEIDWALTHGWTPAEISYTGTNVSDRDLERILASGVHLNVDLLSQLARVGRRAPGSTVGIRVNPRIGASREGGGSTLYTGPRPTKFGILPERLDEAVSLAREFELTVDTVHVHVGDGYLNDGLPTFEETVRRVAAVVEQLREAGCPIAEVNTGGGLGVPQAPGERPLDVGAWAGILATHLGPLDVSVATEPGDFLVKECAVHLAEVVTVEDRDGHTFVGLDTGWNVMNEHFVYGALLDLVLCRAADGEPVHEVTIGGNINEGDDLFAEDRPFPAVEEGDVVAAINVGSYNASMTSVHCLREPAASVSFADRI